jgi:aminoglycoside phosphotransferase (APT) family kinase protein
VHERLPPIIRLFAERYRDALEPEFLALVEKLPEGLARSRDDRSSPRTLQHADFRLDNVLFDIGGGARPMAMLDWQTVSVGPGAMDVAYFLSAGLDPAERRHHEADLMRFYHAELTRRGVRNYDFEARLVHSRSDRDCTHVARPGCRARNACGEHAEGDVYSSHP